MKTATKTIWKFAVEPQDSFEVEMPEDAEVLAVDVQGEKAVMWALVDPNRFPERRTFRVVGTGHTVTDELELAYIGTFMLGGGALVFHLFEKVRADANRGWENGYSMRQLVGLEEAWLGRRGNVHLCAVRNEKGDTGKFELRWTDYGETHEVPFDDEDEARDAFKRRVTEMVEASLPEEGGRG